MNIKEKTRYLMSKRIPRIELCRGNFMLFCLYYFSNALSSPFESFHKEYIRSLQRWDNILFEWFRKSWKTVLLKYYIIRCICYQKYRYIVFFCDESSKANDKVTDIAWQLQSNKLIIKDFGRLFFDKELQQERSVKKRMWDFITQNDIQVQAMWMWADIRWKVFGVPWWKEYRPDLILFDDIDTKKSTNTETLITKNYEYITNDAIGATDDNFQIVFLYNTIKEDWVWPRLRKSHSHRNYIKVPLIDASMNPDSITWKSRFTIEDVLKIEEDSWPIAFWQNYLLIPYVWWQTVVKRHWIRNYETLPTDWKITWVIWVDPSFSEKTKSDPFAITVTAQIDLKDWEWKVKKYYYVEKAIELRWEEKTENKATQTIYNLYVQYWCSIVNVEWNNWWEIIARMLKRMWCSVNVLNSTKDKVTRLTEKEFAFSSLSVFFKTWNTESLTTQLLAFPNAKHDDLVDSMVFSMEEKKFRTFTI